MKRYSASARWDTLLVAAVVLTAGVCANAQQAIPPADGVQSNDGAPSDDRVQSDDKAQQAGEPDGPIVRIAPGGEDIDLPNAPITGGIIADEPNRVPAYWIGITGRRVLSPVLRTQLQLAEDLGIVVEGVVPESPAAKAGLSQHDVILRAGEEPVLDMRVLQQVVLQSGSEPIELQLIRMGQEMTVTVVPEKRPAGALAPMGPSARNFSGRIRHPDQLQRLLEELQRRGGFHPDALDGMLRGGQPGMDQMPSDLSVTITREGDGPTKISVKRGGDSWEIAADDPEALEQLPEDIRPFVERMLKGSGGQIAPGQHHFDHGALEGLLPLDQLPEMQFRGGGPSQMLERMEKLEERFQDLQERLEKEQ